VTVTLTSLVPHFAMVRSKTAPTSDEPEDDDMLSDGDTKVKKLGLGRMDTEDSPRKKTRSQGNEATCVPNITEKKVCLSVITMTS
jgi:hypothetical protein